MNTKIAEGKTAGGRRPEAGGQRQDLFWPSAFGLGLSAFSLVELIIALAILSVGLVGAMRVFPMGLRASQRAEQSSRAVIAAQRAIESVKLKAWDELAEGTATAQDEDFDVTTRISQPTLAGLSDHARIKTIEVTVRSKLAVRSREMAFVTYLRREPP